MADARPLSTFYGKTRQQLEFSDTSISEPIRTKEEPFFSLLVDVAEEGRNVYDGLDAVFDDSPVEIEGKRARRRVSLVEVPALLQIQLQRVQYDREKQKIFKSNQHMAFGPEISLDRYLQVDDDDVEGKRRRNRTTKYRKEIEKCRARLSKLKSKVGRPLSAESRSKLIRLLTTDHRRPSNASGDLQPSLAPARPRRCPVERDERRDGHGAGQG